MSFTLELLHAPRLLGFSEAVELTAFATPADATMRQRFRRFARTILRHYPDGCAADEDGDDPANAWAEAPDPEAARNAVWVIAPKTGAVDEAFMAHVALAAAAADLHVLDPQNALLYRPDRTLVRADGSPVRLPTPPRRAPAAVATAATAARPDPAFTESAVLAWLHERFAERFAARGFALAAQRVGAPVAQRQRGAVRQRVSFHPFLRDGEMGNSIAFRVEADGVAQVWQRLLGDEVAAYVDLVRRLSLTHELVDLYTDDLKPGGDAHQRLMIGRYRFPQAADIAGVESWLEGLFGWLEAEGMAELDRLDSPSALARLLLTDAMHEQLERRDGLTPWQQYDRLVLAAAFAGLDDGRWTGAIFQHWERRHRHTKDWVTVLPDFRGTLERLIERLRAPEGAAELARLRGAP